MAPDRVENEPPVRADRDARSVESAAARAVFQLDSTGTITTWPASARALYGYGAESTIGRELALLFEDPAGLDRPVERLLGQATGSQATHEAVHQRADGSSFRATLTISPLATAGGRGGYVVVSQDRTDHGAYVRRLERQNDRLKEFTDILVHDLRNPLQVIDHRLALYRETGDEGHLESIVATTDRMERLVEDLLRVARQGDLVTEPEPVDLGDVLAVAWEPIETASGDATLVDETAGTIMADADRLCELFGNLFRNAVEHAGSDATVRVGSMANGLYVEDDGPGIPPELREEVFDHGVTTEDDGTGYGLSVVNTIANAHGWDVAATVGSAGGARFEFSGVDSSV